MFFTRQDFINKKNDIIDGFALGLMKVIVPELEKNGYVDLTETINASKGVMNAICGKLKIDL
jgi:hypothetical protein